MKYREISPLILAGFLLVFASLLLSGAPRLIASESDGALPVCPRRVSAYLCAPISASPSAEVEISVSRSEHAARMSTAVMLSCYRMDMHPTPRSDANGNVLAAQSYMRSVYQVFALGDGFA